MSQPFSAERVVRLARAFGHGTGARPAFVGTRSTTTEEYMNPINRVSRRSAPPGALIFFAIMSGQAFAQVAPAEKPAPQEEVVEMSKFIVPVERDVGYGASQATIGSRSVKPLIEIPSSIYVVNKEIIDDLSATYGSQALKFVSPGTTPYGDTSGDGSNIRGFSSGVMRDGTRLLWYKHMPMYDVERIEVVKGPSNMLIGGDASFSGGAINFVTKRPTAHLTSDAKVTVGNHGYYRFEGDLSGPITKSDEFTALYRITLGGETGDPVKPMNIVDQKFLGAGLTLKFGNRIRVDANAFIMEDNTDDYWSDFLDINKSVAYGPAVLNQYDTPTFAPGLPSQAKWDTTWHVINVTLTASLTENGSLRMYYADLSGSDKRWTLRGISVAADNVTLNRQDIAFDLSRKTKTFQLEYLYSTKRDWWSNDFQIGAEQGWIYDGTKNSLATPPPLNTANPDYSYTRAVEDFGSVYWNLAVNTSATTLGSYWAQDNLTLFKDKVILVGGLRWNDRSKVDEAGNPVVQPGNMTVAYTKTLTDDHLIRTYRYGIVYQPFKDFSVYYCDASNLTPVAGINFDGSTFKDSAGKLREFGAKFATKGDHFSTFGSFSVFDMAQTNIRTSVVDASVPGGIRYFQTARDQSKGWETQVGGRLTTSGGFAQLIATYYDAKTKRAADGRSIPGAPDNTYSLLAKYTWTATMLKGLTVGAGCYDQTKILTGGNYTIDFPVTYNLMANYRVNEKWSFQFNGNNVTNERYISNVITAGLVQVAPEAEYRLSSKYVW